MLKTRIEMRKADSLCEMRESAFVDLVLHSGEQIQYFCLIIWIRTAHQSELVFLQFGNELDEEGDFFALETESVSLAPILTRLQ